LNEKDATTFKLNVAHFLFYYDDFDAARLLFRDVLSGVAARNDPYGIEAARLTMFWFLCHRHLDDDDDAKAALPSVVEASETFRLFSLRR
jgi:hypothetical protein